LGEPLLKIPDSLKLGDFINSIIKMMKYPEGRMYKYSFSGSVNFNQMKEKELYTNYQEEIKRRVKDTKFKRYFFLKDYIIIYFEIIKKEGIYI
jgi:hypothetical protein